MRRNRNYPKEKLAWVDYKDVAFLRRFLGTWGKMKARRETGLSAPQQRRMAEAIKRARLLALLPYASR